MTDATKLAGESMSVHAFVPGALGIRCGHLEAGADCELPRLHLRHTPPPPLIATNGREPVKATPPTQGRPQAELRHGTEFGYKKRHCRCEDCTRAHREAQRAYQNARADREGRPRPRIRIVNDPPGLDALMPSPTPVAPPTPRPKATAPSVAPDLSPRAQRTVLKLLIGVAIDQAVEADGDVADALIRVAAEAGLAVEVRLADEAPA